MWIVQKKFTQHTDKQDVSTTHHRAWNVAKNYEPCICMHQKFHDLQKYQTIESAQGWIAQPAADGEGVWVCFFVSMPRQCLKVIRNWTKSVIWAKSPKQTPGPGRTNGHAWMGPTPPGKCKMWCSDKIISFWHPDRHTHTRQNLYIFAWKAGCNNYCK